MSVYTFHGKTRMYVQKERSVLVFPTLDDMEKYVRSEGKTGDMTVRVVKVTKPDNYTLYFKHVDILIQPNTKCRWMFQIVKPFTHLVYGRVGAWGFWYY